MNWSKGSSLKLNTIILLMTALLLVMISLIGYTLYREWRDSVLNRALEHMDNTSILLQREVNVYFENQRKPVVTLAGMPEIIEASNSGGTEALTAANHVLDVFCTTLNALTCYLMDRSGMTIASSNRHSAKSFVGKNYSFRPYFREAITGKNYVYLALGVTSRKRGIYFSSPIHQNKKIIGVAVIKVSVEEIERKFAFLQGIASVTDPDGVIFSTNQSSWLYKKLEDMTGNKVRKLARRNTSIKEGSGEVALRGRIEKISTLGKMSYLIVERPLSYLKGWKINYLADTREIAMLQDRGVYKIITSGTGVLLMLVIIITLLLYRAAKSEISARRKAENNIYNAMEQAEKASQAKSEFLSRMSHELRTPLNAILGFGQMLELDEEGFSLTQKENVKEILTAGQHLLNLINEVLDLSRIEAGKMEVSLETIDLDELLQHTLSLVCHQAEERGVSIEDHVSGNNLTVFCDVMRLQQVLLNLLSNAVKYNRDKGQVVIDARSDGNHLELSIRDQGRGLSQKEIDRLFVPFDRLNADRDVQGTGIGLVITRHLLELMGGRLEIESEPGIGSVFRVVLPAAEVKRSSSQKPNLLME